MTFYCKVGGNPSPAAVEWRFKGRKIRSGAKYLINEGVLIVENLNYSDAGQYTCAARNILGSSEATGNLSVRGKRIEYLTLSLINRYKKTRKVPSFVTSLLSGLFNKTLRYYIKPLPNLVLILYCWLINSNMLCAQRSLVTLKRKKLIVQH